MIAKVVLSLLMTLLLPSLSAAQSGYPPASQLASE
jgi:hypothetical protein